MTSDRTVELLQALMDVRERLQHIQAELADITQKLLDTDPRPTQLTHATEPQPNASLRDEPPSRPLGEVTRVK